MFEGTKLSYIVPGYTGFILLIFFWILVYSHIPKSYYFDDG